MSIDVLREFFMWCLILNAGFLAVAFGVCAGAGDWVYRMHSRWFPMPRETFNVTIYGLIGRMKLAVLVFNLVPWLALVIVG